MIGIHSFAEERRGKSPWEKEETEGKHLGVSLLTDEKPDIKNPCRKKWLKENTCAKGNRLLICSSFHSTLNYYHGKGNGHPFRYSV